MDAAVSEAPVVEVRSYRREDASATLTTFLDAINETAAADFSPEQIAAWARPEQRTVPEWDRAMGSRNSYVAVLDQQIVGFSDVNADDYIDMIFVSRRRARVAELPRCS